MKTRTGLPQRSLCSSGQSIIEFSIILPLVLVLVLGVVEFSYELLDLHIVTKLAREGSNLISRDTDVAAAGSAVASMSSRPVDFSNGSSRLIFSVVRTGTTTGTSNFNKQILYQRYELGTLSTSLAPGALNIAGSGSFPAPTYQAVNPDSNTGLQVTNLPASLVGTPGMIYVTEIYTRHTLITPWDRFGFKLPETLYSIAYF
jgi:Flp pilus assembly protein TadG